MIFNERGPKIKNPIESLSEQIANSSSYGIEYALQTNAEIVKNLGAADLLKLKEAVISRITKDLINTNVDSAERSLNYLLGLQDYEKRSIKELSKKDKALLVNEEENDLRVANTHQGIVNLNLINSADIKRMVSTVVLELHNSRKISDMIEGSDQFYKLIKDWFSDYKKSVSEDLLKEGINSQELLKSRHGYIKKVLDNLGQAAGNDKIKEFVGDLDGFLKEIEQKSRELDEGGIH